MAWEECVAGILKAGEGRLTENDVEAILTEIAKRAERNKKARLSPEQKFKEAAERMAMEVEEAAAILKRNEILNLRKRVTRRAGYQKAPDMALGLEAKLVGVNTPFEGHRLSVYSQYDALLRDYHGGLYLDLKREKLERLFASRSLEKEWAAELFDLNSGGKGGVTGNKEALAIAKTLRKWQRVAVEGMNAEGAWIRDYQGYITRTTHDADRIHRMGEKAWIDLVMREADIIRTFGTPQAAAEALPGLYRDFATGRHYRLDEDALEDFALPGINLANKASATRVIHFPDSDSWLRYTEAAGYGNATEIMVQGLHRAAKWTALLREYGTNPRASFEADLEWAKDKGTIEQARRVTSRETALTNRFDVLDGTASMPVNRLAADITSGWMAWLRMAKLGSAPFAAVTDVATKAAELRYQGVNLLERYTSGLSAYFKGRGGLTVMGAEQKEVADLVRAGLDGAIGRMVARFDRVETPRGWLSKAENWFHRLTGLTAMTDRQRMDAELIMARHLGTRKGKAWSGLEPQVQRILTGFKIGEREWDLLRSVDWKQANGRNYLTPDVARKIDDAAVERRLRAEGTLKDDASTALVAREVARWKEDLALRVHTYYADRGTYAVLETGAREQAILLQGRQPGTPLGVALRLWAQLKGFPTAMIVRAWGRELYGGQGRMGAMSGLVQMIVGATVLGYAGMALRDLAKGRTPRDPTDPKTWTAAFLQGGAGTIYADFAFGEFNRFGRSAVASLAGPTFGQIDDVMEVIGRMRSGEDPGAQAFRVFMNNVPGQNLWYSRMALDYLILYQIQDALSPGYLRRMEKRVKTENKQTFWLRPSEAVR